MKNILSFFTVLILLGSCQEPKDSDDCHYKIKIKNNSDKVLYLYSAGEPVITPGDIRTDPFFKPAPAHAGNGTVEMGAIRYLGGGKPKCVESFYPAEKQFYVFVFDSAAIAQKSWKEVIDNNLFVKRFDITVKELQKTDFTLEYSEE